MTTVIITGADRGFGLALVQCFLEAGARVFAGRYGDDHGLLRTQQTYRQQLGIVDLDVTDPNSIRAAAAVLAAQTGGVDILVNNAGVYLEQPSTPLAELDLADQHLEQTMAVNAFGPLRVTQQLLALLEQGVRKTIVNVSSEAGSIADAQRTGEFAYCMSKAALNMQTRLLSNLLGPRGYRVCAVHPGWMRTQMGGPTAEIDPPEAAEGIVQLALSTDLEQLGPYLDYRSQPLRW
jgi:NAD(P)-dependent dehydrogenase (short-subunit alcohol dehydrogenase family)